MYADVCVNQISGFTCIRFDGLFTELKQHKLFGCGLDDMAMPKRIACGENQVYAETRNVSHNIPREMNRKILIHDQLAFSSVD